MAAALVFSHSRLKWPTSTSYRDTLFPALAKLLTTADLFNLRAIAASPGQWPHVATRRARIVANLLQQRWSVLGQLSELPAEPEWLINTTCVETGKNWRFSKRVMGDWAFGHHYGPAFKIAEAAAASAAVPYVIGSLRLKLPPAGWYEIDPATDRARARKAQPFKEVNLWDGGAYENIGLEPLYKLDRGMIGCDYIVVSDASGPLPPSTGSPVMALLRGGLSSPRLFDIASDQIRSLRSRMFVHALRHGSAKGALIRMGNSVRDLDLRIGRNRPNVDYARFLPDQDVALALKYPTNLASLDSNDFQLIARHGFEATDATLTAHCSSLAPSAIVWSQITS